jgi:hypothetical protein
MDLRVLRVVVASPGDVKPERDIVPKVVEEVNRNIARERGLHLEVYRWETDSHPGFHPQGPQGLIDPQLKIEDCDLLIGIFWHRFGTPTSDANAGTAHEFRLAYKAWQQKRQPQIMVYFCQKKYFAKSRQETEQAGLVLQFKEDFPKEGLWWDYKNKSEFERFVRNHLTSFLNLAEQPAKTTKARITIEKFCPDGVHYKIALEDLNPDMLKSFREDLRSILQDSSVQILGAERGSVRLVLEMSSAAFERLKTLNEHGNQPLAGYLLVDIIDENHGNSGESRITTSHKRDNPHLILLNLNQRLDAIKVSDTPEGTLSLHWVETLGTRQPVRERESPLLPPRRIRKSAVLLSTAALIAICLTGVFLEHPPMSNAFKELGSIFFKSNDTRTEEPQNGEDIRIDEPRSGTSLRVGSDFTVKGRLLRSTPDRVAVYVMEVQKSEREREEIARPVERDGERDKSYLEGHPLQAGGSFQVLLEIRPNAEPCTEHLVVVAFRDKIGKDKIGKGTFLQDLQRQGAAISTPIEISIIAQPKANPPQQ